MDSVSLSLHPLHWASAALELYVHSLGVHEGQCCPRVAASPYRPNSPVTQLGASDIQGWEEKCQLGCVKLLAGHGGLVPSKMTSLFCSSLLPTVPSCARGAVTLSICIYACYSMRWARWIHSFSGLYPTLFAHGCIYKHVSVALPGDGRQIAFGPEGVRNMFSLWWDSKY